MLGSFYKAGKVLRISFDFEPFIASIFPEQEMNKGFSDLWMSPNFLNHPEMQYCYVVEFKYLKHEATDAEVAAKLEEAREQLKLYAGDVKHEQAKGHTTLRRIAVVYRAWEMAALEEV